MKNIIIFGLGSVYQNLKEYLKSKYNIVAFTSNNKGDGLNTEYLSKYINPDEINKYEYDFIYICSSYYKEITKQLVEILKIDKEKIKCLCNYESITSKKAMTSKEIYNDILEYNLLNKRDNFKIEEKNIFICANDKYQGAGSLNKEYFMQDIWAAKKIFKNSPKKHYDIGSRIDGFISHLLSFREEVTLIDLRPMEYDIEGIKFIKGNAMNLDNIHDGQLESLSSLSVIEHFGLGRYGDPINPEGCFKAMKEFQRVMQKGGKLYLAVPVSNIERLCFNAHRVFNPLTIIKEFDKMNLDDFSYVIEHKVKKTNLENLKDEILDIGDYAAGLFEFTKM